MDDFDDLTLALSDDDESGPQQRRRDPPRQGNHLRRRMDLLARNEKHKAEIRKRLAPSNDKAICHVDRDLLYNLGMKVRCPDCEDDRVSVDVRNYDIDTSVIVTCNSCNDCLFEQTPDSHTGANLRSATAGLVSHCMQTGTGYMGCKKYESAMNVETGLSKRRYYDYTKEIGKKTIDMCADQAK